MRSAWVSTTLVLAMLSIFAISCDKTETGPTTTTPTKAIGGKGGYATLLVTPVHDGLNIDSCMVYIKYDAPVVPANNVYDDSMMCTQINGTPTAKFTDLRTGEYYLYAKGWDIIRSEKVRGGMPYEVNDSTAKTTHTTILPIQPY